MKKKSILSKVNINTHINYTSAGSLYTNNKLVLCGYQQNKQNSTISGFGGKKETTDESYIETAIRETLEELFNIVPNKEIIHLINANINHNKLIIQDNYYMLVYSFDDLELMLNLLNKNQITSKLYDSFPVTLSDLILNRKINNESEISHICLLPLKQNITINNEFIKDINHFFSS